MFCKQERNWLVINSLVHIWEILGPSVVFFLLYLNVSKNNAKRNSFVVCKIIGIKYCSNSLYTENGTLQFENQGHSTKQDVDDVMIRSFILFSK